MVKKKLAQSQKAANKNAPGKPGAPFGTHLLSNRNRSRCCWNNRNCRSRRRGAGL